MANARTLESVKAIYSSMHVTAHISNYNYSTGFDRLVAVLCGGVPLTDTIAFPKSARGYDLMCKAPSTLSQDVLDTYHVQIKDKIS